MTDKNDIYQNDIDIIAKEILHDESKELKVNRKVKKEKILRILCLYSKSLAQFSTRIHESSNQNLYLMTIKSLLYYPNKKIPEEPETLGEMKYDKGIFLWKHSSSGRGTNFRAFLKYIEEVCQKYLVGVLYCKENERLNYDELNSHQDCTLLFWDDSDETFLSKINNFIVS